MSFAPAYLELRLAGDAADAEPRPVEFAVSRAGPRKQ